MASIDERYAALELSSALRDLDSAQAEIDKGDWWDGPPFSMEERRDRAVDRVMSAVRSINALAAARDEASA